MSANAIKQVYQTLEIDKQGPVVTVSLNRPEVRNAFHPSMIAELTEVFAALSQVSDVSAIILRGRGASFCAGADLGYMKSMAAFTYEENERDAQSLFEMFWTLANCPHPVIGKVHGHAMGGAVGLVSICDVAAAESGTKFCFSEVKLGLVPAVISPFILQKMNPGAARRYMLSAEVFEASEALTSGLVQFVGSETEVDGFIKNTAQNFSASGPEAVRATKKLLKAITETTDWQKRREVTTHVIAERRVSAEGQEGLKAYLEKRAPHWKPRT
jgi:methylglutaconyl-CoA hydratase